MNTSQDDASQDGASLLSTFVSARNASRSAKKGKSDDSNLDTSISMYFDAVADGNNVGRVYSATKKGGLNLSDSAASADMIFGTPNEQSRLGNTTFVAAEIEPLELIRDAMRKLKGVAIVNEGGDETADGLQEAMDALQIFEERILHHNSSNNNTSNSDVWASKGQAAGGPFSPIGKENSVPNTPVTDKVRMQLESAVAELTERLEVVEEERDEQADLAKALQQDLEGKDLLLEEQKEELKLHKQICDELTSQLSESITTGGSPTPKKEDRQASASSSSSPSQQQQQPRVSTPSSEDAKSSRDVLKVYMENQLDLQASEQSEYEQMTDVLLSKLEGVEAELASRDEELAKMTTEHASLTAENTRLADELLEAQEELEEQEGVEARLKGRMLELESCILQVRGTDEVLTSDVSMNIMDLSEKLSEERERCRLLQNMVTNLKESSADTDELLVVLKEDKEELEVDFECLNKDFEEQVQELAKATEEVTRLSLELRESVDKEREATAKRNQLEEDLASLKVQIGTHSAEVSEVEDKRREMNALLEEKRALGQEIREQARQIERKEEQLRVKEEELERSKGEFARTKEALQEALDEVEKESSQRSELMKELQGLLLLRHSSPGSVDNSLVIDEDSPLNMSGFSNWGGGGSPDNSMMSVSGLQQQGGGQQGGQNNADIEVLHEKLENAEKRAAEAMQSDVEHLTKNAILDGECSRLRQMTSELKETNSKLEGDVQTAKKEAARYKALEKTAKKLKADLSKTKAALDEASMLKRDQEQHAQFQESELVAKFESESEELQDRVKSLETELQESREHISNSAQAAQEQDEQIRLLMEQRDEYQREVSSLESECEGAMASSEEVKEELEQGKKELQDVREELRSTQERLADASAKMARDNQEFSSRLEAAAAAKVKLERDISTMNMGQSSLADQLKDIEAHSEAVQKQLRETTDSLTLSSKQKEELTRRINEADVELAKRYTRIEKLSDEVDEWERRFDDFKQTEHKLLQDTHQALQSDMEALKTELMAASQTVTDTQRELDSARGQQSELSSKYQVLDGAFTELQEKDLREREVRVRELQTELQQKLHDQEALEERVAELTRQLQQSQKDNDEIRDAEESKKRLLDELDQRMSVVEDEKRNAVAELNQRVQREGLISGEIASIKDSLVSCISISASNVNAPLSPTPAAAAASLLTLGSSSSSSDLAASVEDLRTYCAEAQRLLFAQGVATSELCHEQESQQHQVDNLTSQVGALQNIRDGLTSDVRRLEEALSFSEQKVEFKEREAEYLLQNSEEWNSKVRIQIRDLRGAIADAYSHITRLTAATGTNNASAAMPSPIKPATQGAGDDTSSASLLSQVHVEMETALRMLVSAMETASQEAMTRKVALDTAEASLQEQQEQLRRELDNSAVLEEQLVKDGEQLESAQQLQHQLAKLTHEHTQYKVMLSELNRNKIELSAEYDASQAMIADLRKALTEAERLCQDYRQQHSDLLQEHDGLSTHLHLLQQQSVAAVARADEQEATAEKSRREVTALRAEMEEMVRLQKTLESELSRNMSAPSTPHGATPHHGLEDSTTPSGDNADAEAEAEAEPTQVLSNFDSERLLGAMYSTSDQLVLASFAVDEEAALHLRKLQAMSRAALEVNSGATMQGRYEAAVRFLGELRLWSRNEKKAKRVLMTKLTDTEKELTKVKNDVAEKGRSEKQWREAKQSGDAEIRGLERRLRELQSATDRRHNDVSKMKDSVHGWEKRYEEERNMRLQLSRQLQQMDMEANKAQLQVADDKTTIASLNSSLSAEKDRADKLEQDSARRAEEVRALKTNNSRLVHLLEVDSSRLQHDSSSSSSSSASEGANAFVASLQERVAELEGSLSAAKTVTQQLKQGKTAEELSGASVRRELESLKGKFSQVETRYVEMEHEKKRLQQELLDARAATTAAEQRASLASDRSSRAEAALESLSLSRAGTASAADDRLAPFVEANQQQIRSLQTRLDETDKSRRQAEEERIALRGRLSELKSAMDIVGSEATADKVSKEALEKELENLKQQLSAHSLSEGAAGNSAEMREMVAALLKSDAGRELKRRVREATLATREVVNIVRADAVAQDGTYFSSPDPKPSTGPGPHAQLLEGSGVRELSDSLEAMRMCIGWLRDAPRQRNALTSNNARQEATVKDLQKELGVVQRRHDTALARVQAELKAVESQLATEQSRSLALRDREASAEAENKANSQHKEQLQRSLADERARSRSLEEDVRELEVQVEELGEMLDEKTRQHAAADEELKKLESFVRNEDSAAATSGVVRGVRRVRNDSHDHGSASDELLAAQQELRALSHHRDALSSTLEKMEDKIKLLSSSASAAAAAAHGMQQQHSGDGHPQQREARLRSRLDALEGLLGVYKNGIKGLYGSSSAYAYAQYAASRSGYGFAEAEDPLQGGPLGSWSGWGRLELGTLKSSFDAEIKAVDSEVIELRGKVRQSQAFSSELSKRFQGLLSESYARSGGAHQDEGRSETLRHLEGSMSEALEEAAKLRTALHDEKEQARRRHRQLIDVLNGTVAEKEALEAALKALELSGVVVPTIVRRGDFRSNSSSSHSQYASHHHTNNNNSNNSFSFQSPVKTYRSSPAPPHVQMPQMPPSPPAATAAAEPAGAGQGGSSTNNYRLRTKGAGGRGGLRVRRAGGD